MDKNHLEQFQGKCSVITSEKTFDRRMAGKENIGYPPDLNDLKGSMYVSKPEDIDRALIECNGDISKLESSLGFEPGYFGNGPLVRVDINNPENYDLRIATGKEAGANEFWNTKRDSDGNLPTVSYVERKKEDGSSVWCIDTSKTDPAELSKLNGQFWDEKGIYHPPKPDGYDGKTSGNLAEAVINQVPNTPENITYTKIDGFKRGEDSKLSYSNISNGYDKNITSCQLSSQTAVSNTGGGTHAPPNSTYHIRSSDSKNDSLKPKPTNAKNQTPVEPDTDVLKGKGNSMISQNQSAFGSENESLKPKPLNAENQMKAEPDTNTLKDKGDSLNSQNQSASGSESEPLKPKPLNVENQLNPAPDTDSLKGKDDQRKSENSAFSSGQDGIVNALPVEGMAGNKDIHM